MDEIGLQFQTPQQFASFRAYIKERPTAIDILRLIIYCRCLTEEIEAAIKIFGGKVINNKLP